MFTGIVEEVGKVISISPGRLDVAASKTLEGMEPGSSMAVNGICLTITELKPASFAVDVMPETVARTNLGSLKSGSEVNLERPMTLGGRLGGHLVQGHIDGTGKIASITPEGEALIIRFEATPAILHYIVEKGFVAVDGISLTVVNKDDSSFSISMVGYTLKNTNFRSRRVGDPVNIEVDIIAKYVEQLSRAERPGGITMGFLEEHGFLTG